jgi:hypothetical protein
LEIVLKEGIGGAGGVKAERIGGERDNNFMDNFIIWTKNGYEFSSIERRAICFFIHLQEGYENFHPLT